MKKHEIPALLSLLAPGFGQLVKGHSGKLIAIWAIVLLLLLNLKNGWLDISDISFYTGIAYFLLTAWGVYDAYNAPNDWKGMV